MEKGKLDALVLDAVAAKIKELEEHLKAARVLNDEIRDMSDGEISFCSDWNAKHIYKGIGHIAELNGRKVDIENWECGISKYKYRATAAGYFQLESNKEDF